MARIQVLPFPPERVGDVEHTPFAIVIDDGADGGEAREAFPMEAIEYLRMQSGAATVILFDGCLEVGSPLTLSEEQQATILDRLTSTPFKVTNGVGDTP